MESEESGETCYVRLIDRSYIKILSNRVKELLVDHQDAKMPLETFLEQFREIYSDDLDIQQLKSDLKVKSKQYLSITFSRVFSVF